MLSPTNRPEYVQSNYLHRYRELELENKPILVLLKTAKLRFILSNALNYEQVIPTDDGLKRDYRGLSELLKLPGQELRNVERNQDPMLSILVYLNGLSTSSTGCQDSSLAIGQFGSNGLNNYIASANGQKIVNQFATIELLVRALEQLDRFDVIDDLLHEMRTNPIDESAIKELAVFNQKQLTQNRPLDRYDAYVSYVDSDLPFVQELCNFLESPEINFKLFIRGRDLLMGQLELADFTELMEKQCNKLLVILSPQFIESAECEFQTKFTLDLQIGERNRRLIPIIYRPVERQCMPGFIKCLSKIDLSKGNLIPNWTWQKLVASISDENRPFLPAINQPSNSSSLSIHTLNSSLNSNRNNTPNLGLQETANRLNVSNSIRSDSSRSDSIRNNSSNSINSLNERKEPPPIKIALEADYDPKKLNSDRFPDRTTISTVTTRPLTTQSFSNEDTQALIEKQKGFKLFSKLWKNLSSKIK